MYNAMANGADGGFRAIMNIELGEQGLQAGFHRVLRDG